MTRDEREEADCRCWCAKAIHATYFAFLEVYQETSCHGKGHDAGLNICGQLQWSCLCITLSKKHSKTAQIHWITSSGAHKSWIFRARKYKDTRVKNLHFTSMSGRKGSHWYIQFVSNGPCRGKLKLQLCKSHQSEAVPIYFWPNSLMKWGLSNYCTCVSISPCNNNLTCCPALIKSARGNSLLDFNFLPI